MSRPAPDKSLSVQDEAEEDSDDEQNDSQERSKSATIECLEGVSEHAS